ncbi:uncharacterized protein KGF55_000326 [Candida pseudojiufengensis]|uniref:uncharacterized protein n=1 Tax=Candida pseudojiufengensis TaxID=497109 RepID=UPI002225AA46|nr:uncharacterized protein KGF55_000326 [Candida pseudojiufengensis]KAI5966917.1 hypothetical protein KGF55_000326 [Candida pseudojiufengensis]
MSDTEEIESNYFLHLENTQKKQTLKETEPPKEEEILVYPSYSLQNSFLSTIDHLPCDIVRSLWLIQSINIKINTYRDELSEILTNYRETNEISDDNLSKVYNLKQIIIQLSNESIQESQTLNNQLVTHKLYLHDEIKQLNLIKDKKTKVKDVNNFKKYNSLRNQLRQHYMENPLKSQIEAINEDKEDENKIKKVTTTTKSGLKLILKLPKQDKITKPIINGENTLIKKGRTKLKTIIKPKLEGNEAKKQQIKPIKKIKSEAQIVEEQKENIIEPQLGVSELEQTYCFCHQPSFGDMISCDNEKSCPNGEWFHYKCVGLLNKVEALKYTTGKLPWYCSNFCREIGEKERAKKLEIQKRKRKRKW